MCRPFMYKFNFLKYFLSTSAIALTLPYSYTIQNVSDSHLSRSSVYFKTLGKRRSVLVVQHGGCVSKNSHLFQQKIAKAGPTFFLERFKLGFLLENMKGAFFWKHENARVCMYANKQPIKIKNATYIFNIYESTHVGPVSNQVRTTLNSQISPNVLLDKYESISNT